MTDNMDIPEPYRSAHQETTGREVLLRAKTVGCFYCLHEFGSSSLQDWIDDGETPLCPMCGIDSVIPMDGRDYVFLVNMKDFWF